jgi:hypothetical protein
MGLDMYMFRVEKLTELEMIEANECHINDIAKDYHFINKSSFDADPEPMSDLIPYITQLTVIDTAFDYNRCFAEHGVNCRYDFEDEEDDFRPTASTKYTDEVVGSWCVPNGAGWSFASGAKIELNREQYESYFYERITEVYAWKAKEVGYWRKFYDFDAFLQKIRINVRTKKCIEQGRVPTKDEVMSWATENCGYYLLSQEEKAKIRDFLYNHDAPFSSKIEDGCLDDDAAIMYHAWW